MVLHPKLIDQLLVGLELLVNMERVGHGIPPNA
jgi:hypothetical protein